MLGCLSSLLSMGSEDQTHVLLPAAQALELCPESSQGFLERLLFTSLPRSKPNRSLLPKAPAEGFMNPVLTWWWLFVLSAFMAHHCKHSEVSCIYQDCWRTNHGRGATASVRLFLFSPFAFILIQMVKRNTIPTEISFPLKARSICSDLQDIILSFLQVISVAFVVVSPGWPRLHFCKISQILWKNLHTICVF